MDHHLKDYTSKRGEFSPEPKSLAQRARELRLFLRELDSEEIVVVSHGDFLHYVSGDVNQDGEQEGGGWRNTEFRSYRFEPVGHDDALMQETLESVRLRGASGPGKELGSGEGAETFLQDGLK